MNKSYNIKIYDKVGDLVTTLTKPISSLSFNNSINSGVDNLTIDTSEHTDTTTFVGAEYVEIIEFSDINKTGTPLFAGRIQSLPGQITENEDTIGLECVGYTYLMSKAMYQVGGSLTFNKTDTITNVITEIVGLANGNRDRNPPISYQGFVGGALLKVDTLPAININIDFDNDTCLDALIKSFEGAGLDFYITPDGTIKSKEKPALATHNLTFRKDVQETKIKQGDKQDLVNFLRLQDKVGITTYEDATSIGLYGKQEKYISKTDFEVGTTADQFGNKFIEDNKDPKREIEIKVNNKYDIASIEPGDYVNIRNSTLGVKNLKILKTSYNGDEMTLYIDKYVSLGQLLL